MRTPASHYLVDGRVSKQGVDLQNKQSKYSTHGMQSLLASLYGRKGISGQQGKCGGVG